jgi:hypothetical protein
VTPVQALWVFVPLLGAFFAHAPVLRFGWFRSLARPMDLGATFRGKRVFGDNKTWRGAIVMTVGVVVFACALSFVPGYWSKLPGSICRAVAPAFGFLLGLGAVLGELPNSFLKRQLDIGPGARRSSLLGVGLIVLDQGDFVLGAWATLTPIWVMPLRTAVVAFALVVAVHAVVNLIGYAIGARKTML